jgi:hypothetical protein
VRQAACRIDLEKTLFHTDENLARLPEAERCLGRDLEAVQYSEEHYFALESHDAAWPMARIVKEFGLVAAFEERAARYAATVDVASGEDAEQFYLACGFRPRSLLVGAFASELPRDYRETEYPITGERVRDGRTFFYVGAPTYDRAHKDAVRERFRASGMNYIFAKRVR